jgi:hypothetical protein
MLYIFNSIDDDNYNVQTQIIHKKRRIQNNFKITNELIYL